MPIDAATKTQTAKILDEYCRKRTLAARGRMEVIAKWRGATVTLSERKPWALDPSGWVEITVAQFRHDPSKGDWSLYCADRNSRWHAYDDLPSAKDIETLLEEVDEDPTGIFWG